MAGIHALEADLRGQGDHGRHFLGIDPRSGERRKACGVYWRARVPSSATLHATSRTSACSWDSLHTDQASEIAFRCVP
jgi:hypothetical protein